MHDGPPVGVKPVQRNEVPDARERARSHDADHILAGLERRAQRARGRAQHLALEAQPRRAAANERPRAAVAIGRVSVAGGVGSHLNGPHGRVSREVNVDHVQRKRTASLQADGAVTVSVVRKRGVNLVKVGHLAGRPLGHRRACGLNIARRKRPRPADHLAAQGARTLPRLRGHCRQGVLARNPRPAGARAPNARDHGQRHQRRRKLSAQPRLPLGLRLARSPSCRALVSATDGIAPKGVPITWARRTPPLSGGKLSGHGGS